MRTMLEGWPRRQMSSSLSWDFINVKKSRRTLVGDSSCDLLFVRCSCSSMLTTSPSVPFTRPSLWWSLVVNITLRHLQSLRKAMRLCLSLAEEVITQKKLEVSRQEPVLIGIGGNYGVGLEDSLLSIVVYDMVVDCIFKVVTGYVVCCSVSWKLHHIGIQV